MFLFPNYMFYMLKNIFNALGIIKEVIIQSDIDA